MDSSSSEPVGLVKEEFQFGSSVISAEVCGGRVFCNYTGVFNSKVYLDNQNGRKKNAARVKRQGGRFWDIELRDLESLVVFQDGEGTQHAAIFAVHDSCRNVPDLTELRLHSHCLMKDRQGVTFDLTSKRKGDPQCALPFQTHADSQWRFLYATTNGGDNSTMAWYLTKEYFTLHVGDPPPLQQQMQQQQPQQQLQEPKPLSHLLIAPTEEPMHEQAHPLPYQHETYCKVDEEYVEEEPHYLSPLSIRRDGSITPPPSMYHQLPDDSPSHDQHQLPFPLFQPHSRVYLKSTGLCGTVLGTDTDGMCLVQFDGYETAEMVRSENLRLSEKPETLWGQPLHNNNYNNNNYNNNNNYGYSSCYEDDDGAHHQDMYPSTRYEPHVMRSAMDGFGYEEVEHNQGSSSHMYSFDHTYPTMDSNGQGYFRRSSSNGDQHIAEPDSNITPSSYTFLNSL